MATAIALGILIVLLVPMIVVSLKRAHDNQRATRLFQKAMWLNQRGYTAQAAYYRAAARQIPIRGALFGSVVEKIASYVAGRVVGSRGRRGEGSTGLGSGRHTSPPSGTSPRPSVTTVSPLYDWEREVNKR